MLLLQERWQVKDSKYSRASPATLLLTNRAQHSCHVCLSWLLGCFSRFSLLLHPRVRPCVQSVPWL